MSRYHVCDVCEAKITKERHWWKEYYRSFKVEHIYPGYNGEHLKEDLEVCPKCWDSIVKKLATPKEQSNGN